MSTYKDTDPCTNIILDFIAGGVPGNRFGESAGNYNATIGHIRASDDLSKLSLIGIYALMKELVDEGQPSSAIGRYQIIKKTLVELQAKANLSNETLFTPELQDKLAIMLLDRRGYQRWWKNVLSDSNFTHNLSCEWASLPDPDKHGKSHYDGVGPNHASTTLPLIYDMLRRAKAVK